MRKKLYGIISICLVVFIIVACDNDNGNGGNGGSETIPIELRGTWEQSGDGYTEGMNRPVVEFSQDQLRRGTRVGSTTTITWNTFWMPAHINDGTVIYEFGGGELVLWESYEISGDTLTAVHPNTMGASQEYTRIE